MLQFFLRPQERRHDVVGNSMDSEKQLLNAGNVLFISTLVLFPSSLRCYELHSNESSQSQEGSSIFSYKSLSNDMYVHVC